jgi:hypothetical protein
MMAEEVRARDCCAASFVNNLSDKTCCVKCAELEVQLQRTLDDLHSAQLIIQML